MPDDRSPTPDRLAAALAKPTPDPAPGRPLIARPLTAAVNLLRTAAGTAAEVLVPPRPAAPEPPRVDVEGHQALLDAGLDPEEWTAKAFRRSDWTMANGTPGESVRWSFERRQDVRPEVGVALDDLFAAIEHRPAPVAAEPTDGPWGYVVALGDMQFGKADGDSVAGTLARTLDVLDAARAKLDLYDETHGIGAVHLAWLGDHVEGFQSQGGANVWRTPLTLSEQVRLVRRVMLHALQLFADTGIPRLSMAAVPGNHGETARFAGKGVTRYDDSHDTEALVAVADVAAADPARYGHVRFLVPDTDELTVCHEVAGTLIGHAHGHQWRTGQALKWWAGQAFGGSPLRDATLLLSGHLHHFHAEADSGRLFVQVPALESESTWWRHATGSTGDPGCVVALTRDGVTPVLEVVRP